MSFPPFLADKNSIIPLNPVLFQLPTDSLALNGITFSKIKSFYSKGYKQFGTLVGKKYGILALLHHSTEVSTLPPPHIIGNPSVWFISYFPIKSFINNAYQLITDGVVLIPPSQGYLTQSPLSWKQEVTEMNLYTKDLIFQVPVLPNQSTDIPNYSYIYRPDGLTIKRPPILSQYDQEQFAIYQQIHKHFFSSSSHLGEQIEQIPITPPIITQSFEAPTSYFDRIPTIKNIIIKNNRNDLVDKIDSFIASGSTSEGELSELFTYLKIQLPILERYT